MWAGPTQRMQRHRFLCKHPKVVHIYMYKCTRCRGTCMQLCMCTQSSSCTSTHFYLPEPCAWGNTQPFIIQTDWCVNTCVCAHAQVHTHASLSMAMFMHTLVHRCTGNQLNKDPPHPCSAQQGLHRLNIWSQGTVPSSCSCVGGGVAEEGQPVPSA